MSDRLGKSRLVGLDEAASLLDLTADGVSALVQAGYLTATPEGAGSPRFAIGDLKTELNGPTFIVTYTITLNGTAAGHPLPSPQHMMTIWHQHKSGWMVIAQSASM